MAETEERAEHALVALNLRYSYKRTPALQGVSLEVATGSIHGFVGPNGAGKTTTLKILATLLRAQGGTVKVLGHDIVRESKQVRDRIGYMPDHFGLYRQMAVFECLDFFAAAYGMPPGKRTSVIVDVLALTDMAGRRDSLVSSLSRGMQQRLSLARALVHDPDLLLLDEPASGLDPRARVELMEILKELSKMGKTIFISSHILSELAGLCDAVTIIDRGWTRYSGSMGDLLARGEVEATYLLTLTVDPPAVREALQQAEWVTAVERADGDSSYRVTLDTQRADTGALLRAVLDNGGVVESFRVEARDLSRVFMDLTEPGVP